MADLQAIVPAGLEDTYHAVKMAPGLRSGDHLYLTGVTGVGSDGTMPSDPETQFRNAFEKIAWLLSEAGSSCASIAEMTSYHIGLRAHFDLFSRVRAEYVSDPYPAWTAVEAAGLRREGAIVEIRVVARVER